MAKKSDNSGLKPHKYLNKYPYPTNINAFVELIRNLDEAFGQIPQTNEYLTRICKLRDNPKTVYFERVWWDCLIDYYALQLWNKLFDLRLTPEYNEKQAEKLANDTVAEKLERFR